MPTYDYKCTACGYAFEKFHSITAKPIKKCPKCGKLKVTRLIGTGAGMIFKGSGFYITDYRSESYKSAAKAETSTSSSSTDKPAAAASGTTESKAPAKSEAKSEAPKKSSSKKSD